MSDREKIIEISHVEQSDQKELTDSVVVEEPLEIRIVSGHVDQRKGKSLSITMRTPGHDFELAIGFLVSEGIIQNRSQIENIEFCDPVAAGMTTPNSVQVSLTPETQFDTKLLQRHFYTTSSCGVCGKASLEALEYQNLKPVDSTIRVDRKTIFSLSSSLRLKQDLFSRTGGIHAAGLFDVNGKLMSVREDVGRHNALDKLIGHCVLNDQFPMRDSILVISGRASFELLQKALVAAIPVFVAVGAPSSLAVDLAVRFDMTLVGFASDTRFNIYSNSRRVELE